MDVRVRTFVAEASVRLEAFLDGLGFNAPQVLTVRSAYPLAMGLRYQRVVVIVRKIRLILAYGGEEYVDTALLWADGESVRRIGVGEDTAHIGHQMAELLTGMPR